MEQIELKAKSRAILGKKVRFLRREGITPANLFGHDVESVALQCDTSELKSVLAQAGKTRLVNLKLDKAREPRKVMVREVQRELLTRELIHVDFYQVRMEEKIKLDVPVVIIGEAPALKLKENSLLHELSSLAVECFPDRIPDNIVIDVSSLTEAEQAIRVKDVVIGEDVTVLNDPELVVVKISSRAMEKVEKKVEEEVVEAVAPSSEAEPKEE